MMTSDPADAFVRLFDLLPEEPFLGDDAERALRSESVLAEAAEVEAHVLDTGAVPAELTGLPVDRSHLSGIGRLIGLDRILRRVHPLSQAPAPPRLQFLGTRYARKGRLNTDATSGLLLPRLVEYGAPEHRPDKHEFFSVIRVLPPMLSNVTFQMVTSAAMPTLTTGDTLVVGCVPFLEDGSDVEINRVDKLDKPRYRLAPRFGAWSEQRVLKTLTALDASGAVIGLLPEGALCGELLSVWQTALATTFSQARRSNSRLAVILIGTGPVTDEEPPRNRAVLLDRKGGLMWEQDKLCDYTLVGATVRDWGLTSILEQVNPLKDGGQAPAREQVDLLEDITRGKTLLVAETPLGRLAVLICEDLQRSDTRQVVPRSLGVSHILTPVFDAPLSHDRWERFAAERHSLWGGSRVAVTNSRVVGTMLGRTGSFGTALGLAPMPGSWTCRVVEGATSAATEVALIDLPPIGPPRS
jgi:predicted amidohydrolase